MTVRDRRVEQAIVRRICAHLGHEPAAGEVIEHETSFFAADGFRLGDHEFDSMDFVEMIVTLEEDFQIAILDAGEIEDVDSIVKLASFAVERADRDRVEAFCRQWS